MQNLTWKQRLQRLVKALIIVVSVIITPNLVCSLAGFVSAAPKLISQGLTVFDAKVVEAGLTMGLAAWIIGQSGPPTQAEKPAASLAQVQAAEKAEAELQASKAKILAQPNSPQDLMATLFTPATVIEAEAKGWFQFENQNSEFNEHSCAERVNRALAAKYNQAVRIMAETRPDIIHDLPRKTASPVKTLEFIKGLRQAFEIALVNPETIFEEIIARIVQKDHLSLQCSKCLTAVVANQMQDKGVVKAGYSVTAFLRAARFEGIDDWLSGKIPNDDCSCSEFVQNNIRHGGTITERIEGIIANAARAERLEKRAAESHKKTADKLARRKTVREAKALKKTIDKAADSLSKQTSESFKKSCAELSELLKGLDALKMMEVFPESAAALFKLDVVALPASASADQKSNFNDILWLFGDLVNLCNVELGKDKQQLCGGQCIPGGDKAGKKGTCGAGLLPDHDLAELIRKMFEGHRLNNVGDTVGAGQRILSCGTGLIRVPETPLWQCNWSRMRPHKVALLDELLAPAILAFAEATQDVGKIESDIGKGVLGLPKYKKPAPRYTIDEAERIIRDAIEHLGNIPGFKKLLEDAWRQVAKAKEEIAEGKEPTNFGHIFEMEVALFLIAHAIKIKEIGFKIKDGQLIAEFDLIIEIGGEVFVVECKSFDWMEVPEIRLGDFVKQINKHHAAMEKYRETKLDPALGLNGRPLRYIVVTPKGFPLPSQIARSATKDKLMEVLADSMKMGYKILGYDL